MVDQWRYPLSDLMDFIRPHAPMAPQTAVEFNLRASMIEFARRSGAMHRIVRIQLQDGMTEYPIELDNCLQPVRVRSICLGGQTMFIPLGSPPCCTCGCFTFWIQNPSCIVIGPAPSCSDEQQMAELTVHIEVAPTQGTCYINDELYNLWGETIANGALARMLLVQSENYSNTDLAVLFDRKFKEGIKKARSDVNANYTRTTQARFGQAIAFRSRR